MAELLDDIAKFLDDNVTGWAVWTGTTGNIHKGMLPDEANSQATTVAVIESPGREPIETMGDNTQPVIEQPMVTVFCRSNTAHDYEGSKAAIRLAWRALTLIANETVNGTYYQRVSAAASPYVDSRDEAGRVVFGQNFNVMRSVTP